MLKTIFIISGLFFASFVQAQSGITGIWQSLNDNNEAECLVELSEMEGNIYGRISKLMKMPETARCEMCPGDLKGQPLVAMQIVERMSLNEGFYKGGKIIDYITGKWHTCEMWLKEGDPNTLVVRSYTGPLYETKYWRRVSEISMK